MRIRFLFLIALRALGRNKLRSVLTMMGVVIGVASVVTMVSIGQGATASVEASISSMGNNLLYVRSGAVSSGGVHWGAGSVKTLTSQDGEAIAKEASTVLAVTPIVRHRAQVVAEDRNWIPGSMEGVGVDYPEVMNWQVAEGRWFTGQEIRSSAKVALLGKTVVKELFGTRSPIGETVRMGKVPIKVIGIMAHRGANAWGRDQDDTVVLPWTTIKTRLSGTGFKNVDRLAVSVISVEAIERAKSEIAAILRDRHRLAAGAADDFQIRDLSLYKDVFTETTRTMTALLSAIASISLLVGGIGIMNIMLVSVSERTREIGIRMAVGAQGRDIMRQFLVESVVLALIGGLIGIGLGIGVSKAVSMLARWPTLLSLEAMAIAMAFCTIIGVSFGYYPAWRASRLDPIESLRYE
ncbi:MAG: ABC transporter permease [Nitrospinota bacterium]